jgi:uncharacterized membrane protein YeaQ/YmgE (transglycosylase-associated protein family)
MPANTNPIFTLAPDIQWTAAPLLAANTTKDGTSGTLATVFTADASNGGFVTKLIARAVGTNVATVLRVFLNTGGVTTTAANNALIAELTLPATTLSEVAAQPAYELPLNFALPPGYRVFCTVGTAVAAGYELTVIGGKY